MGVVGVVVGVEGVSPQGAAGAALLVVPAALPVHVLQALRDLCDAAHQRAAQTLLGAALLLQVGVVGQHLLPLVHLQLGVQLLQLVLGEKRHGALT